MIKKIYRFINGLLLSNGFEFGKATPAQKVRLLADQIRPVNTGIELVRIGGSADGGYLVPDDFKGISTCYSPGVSDTANFENELYDKFGIQSHLADYSVSGPPNNCKPKSFIKKFIGPNTIGDFINLNDWIEKCEGNSKSEDSILQMDIEGGEYLSILATPREVLLKFRIIVLEVHDVNQWSNRPYFEMVDAFFQKLLQDFIVVHLHPNNCCSNINIGGFVSPKVFEISFLRKDRINELNGFAVLPNILDGPNVSHKDDLYLSWYKK